MLECIANRIGNEPSRAEKFGSDSFVACKIMQQTMCSIHFVRYISKKVRARAENLGSARLVANPAANLFPFILQSQKLIILCLVFHFIIFSLTKHTPTFLFRNYNSMFSPLHQEIVQFLIEISFTK